MEVLIIVFIVVNACVLAVLLGIWLTKFLEMLINNHLAQENKKLKSYIYLRDKCDSDIFDRKFYFDDRGDLHIKK